MMKAPKAIEPKWYLKTRKTDQHSGKRVWKPASRRKKYLPRGVHSEGQSRLEAASREVRASEEAPVGVGAGEGGEGDGVDALVGPEEAEEEVDVAEQLPPDGGLVELGHGRRAAGHRLVEEGLSLIHI